jgi:hypothetical protein
MNRANLGWAAHRKPLEPAPAALLAPTKLLFIKGLQRVLRPGARPLPHPPELLQGHNL